MADGYAINRRIFCGGLGLAGLAPIAAGATPVRRSYIGESGKYGTWPLVVGVLTTASPERHGIAIEMLRRREGYPRELRYMSTDRAKSGFALALIDYFAGNPDLRFAAAVATCDDTGSSAPDGVLTRRSFERRRIGDDKSNLAQLSRFLTGCVHGSVAGIAHPLKRQLIRHLEATVGAIALAAARQPADSRFSVIAV